MCVLKARSYLAHDVYALKKLQAAARSLDPLQIFAFEQLHHKVWRTILLAEVVDDDDVRVTEFAGSSSFVPEAREQVSIAFRIQRFDCYCAADDRVVCAEDLAEAASA